LREITGAPVLDADRAEHERLVGGLRTRLGERSFASEWAAGRATSPEEAARFALRLGNPESAAESATVRSRLTRREQEVTALVARGLTNRQVAEQLLVAPRTIETHLEHIFSKLGVQTRTELVAWAVRADVVAQVVR
jgi:non-specific serine/threonine protein kinase